MRRRRRGKKEFDVGELVTWSWGGKKANIFHGLVIDKRDHMGIWVYTVMFENQIVSGFNPEELRRLKIL